MDKTPRRSPGGRRGSPPGPKIKPKHKEAPHNRGAFGDIRKWLAKPNREGRELEGKSQEIILQEDSNLGHSALLETEIEAPPGTWTKTSGLRTHGKDGSQRPPPLWNHPKLLEQTNRKGERPRTQVRIRNEATSGD